MHTNTDMAPALVCIDPGTASAQRSERQPPLSLLDLPLELRHQIYEYHIHDESLYDTLVVGNSPGRMLARAGWCKPNLFVSEGCSNSDLARLITIGLLAKYGDRRESWPLFRTCRQVATECQYVLIKETGLYFESCVGFLEMCLSDSKGQMGTGNLLMGNTAFNPFQFIQHVGLAITLKKERKKEEYPAVLKDFSFVLRHSLPSMNKLTLDIEEPAAVLLSDENPIPQAWFAEDLCSLQPLEYIKIAWGWGVRNRDEHCIGPESMWALTYFLQKHCQVSRYGEDMTKYSLTADGSEGQDLQVKLGRQMIRYLKEYNLIKSAGMLSLRMKATIDPEPKDGSAQPAIACECHATRLLKEEEEWTTVCWHCTHDTGFDPDAYWKPGIAPV